MPVVSSFRRLHMLRTIWFGILLSVLCLCHTGCSAEIPSSSATPASSFTPSAEPAAEVPGSVRTESPFSKDLEITNSWQENGQFVSQYSLTLHAEETVSDWSVLLSVPKGTVLRDCWNTQIQMQKETEWLLLPNDYNRNISSGSSLSGIGWIASCPSNEPIRLLNRDASPSVLPSPPASAEKRSLKPLQVRNGRLCDSDGTTVQLQGVSTHGLAWFPQYVNRDAFLTLRDDWNVNTIRLAMYTAEDGGYCTNGNQAYLKEVIDHAVWLGEELGLYIIIDWHILSDRHPDEHEAEAIAFFSEAAQRYSDCDHVIYEICNEPQDSPFVSVIRPYAENVIRAIRSFDNDALILVGTNTWCQDITEVIGNEIKDPNVMYTLHFYAASHQEALRNSLRTALNAGVPVFISECSICDASGTGPVNLAEAEQWKSLIQENQLSWIAWSLCSKNETSALIQNSCSSTGNWQLSDLSETGRWFRSAFRREPG